LENAFSTVAPLTANFGGTTGLTTDIVIDPFVHVSYVIDVSGSTDATCDGTRTILQCEKDSIIALNIDVAAAGATVDVSVVSFASVSIPQDLNPIADGVQVLAKPSDLEVMASISSLISGGGTRFKNATKDAIDAITLSKENPAVTETFVVFFSDGVENTIADVSSEIDQLNALGTTVFTFAVGEGSSCSDNLLELAVGTGGVCTEVVDATTLTDVLRGTVIPDRELAATEISLNGTPLPIGTSADFFGDGPFDISTGDIALQAGTNEVCITSTSTGADTAGCCVAFEVVEPEVPVVRRK
jgi:hypothetical protein